jgi:hypothetical protein
LEDDQGQNIYSIAKIGEQCREFYVRLYVRRAPRDNNKEAMEVFLSCMKDKILVLMKRRPVAPIIEE